MTRSRPAVAVVAPALTRHILFFFPHRDMKGESGDVLDETTSGESIEEAVEQLLNLTESREGAWIQSSLKDTFIINMKQCLKERKAFSVNMGTIIGFRCRITITLYKEYFTFSYILDKWRPTNSVRKNTDCVNDLAGFAHDISTEIEKDKQFTELNGKYRYDSVALQQLSTLDLFVYNYVWIYIDFLFFGTLDSYHTKWLFVAKSNERGFILNADPLVPCPEASIFTKIQRFDGSGIDIKSKTDVERYFDRHYLFF